MRFPLRRSSVCLLLVFPVLMGSRCKKEPPVEPDNTGPDLAAPPEVEVQVISIDPASGMAGSAFPATLYGAGFEKGARVHLFTTEATNVVVMDENTATMTVPGLAEGVYDVTLTNMDGQRAVLRKGLTISDDAAATRACQHLTLYFDFDKSDVRADATSLLSSNLSCLSRSRGTIQIQGHCDSQGTTDYNLALGQRRAASVQRYLVNQGIPPSRIETISYGEERPAVKGSGEAAWSQNRRAEIYVQQ